MRHFRSRACVSENVSYFPASGLIVFSIVAIGLWPVFHNSALGQVRATSVQQRAKKKSVVGEIDVEQSRIYVFVGKTGFGHEHGVVGKVRSGSLRLNEAKNAGSIVFDMTTFVADTTEARTFLGLKGETSESTRVQVSENMRGAAVLDVVKFPTATFKINSALPIKRRDPDENPIYQLDGTFMLRDVTRPLRVDVEAEEVDGKLHIHGEFPLKQTEVSNHPFFQSIWNSRREGRAEDYGEICGSLSSSREDRCVTGSRTMPERPAALAPVLLRESVRHRARTARAIFRWVGPHRTVEGPRSSPGQPASRQ